MRLALAALVLSLATTTAARADIEVGPPPADAHTAPDAAATSSGGGGCSASPGTTEGAIVFTALGAIGLASFVSRRRARR
jgi:MYXO-CTERM domain-containing protein